MIVLFSIGVAAACVVLPPWFAFQEARRQGFVAAAEIAQTYAQDVLHRADETARQTGRVFTQLERVPDGPCSEASLRLMRQLDLTSTYIQAMGHVRDGAVVCSSMGGPPIPLGGDVFRTARGVLIHPRVPVDTPGASPLMAVVRNGFAVLVHRDLPLDTSTAIPGVALGVMHLDALRRGPPELAKGLVKREWLARLGARAEAVFIDGGQLVALRRSPEFRIVAVAAVPMAYLEERAAAIAWRLVPAGALFGLALAAAVLLLARQQRSLPTALRQGLRRNEFHLHYQPIVDLDSGRWVGLEALLRWRRAGGETIGPELFIPVAERSGMMSRLTERVFELAAADLGAFLASHPGFHLAVNLCPTDLHSEALLGMVDRFLERTGAGASSLMVEITERGLLDVNSARRIIAALRARGVGIAVDDFGTGYSSLSYLETLELDYLKIDRSFIEAIGTGAPTSQVVGHIVAMARAMGLRMIAEGIESEAQAEFLRGHAVQYAQGWLFGKPAPAAEVLRLAQAGEGAGLAMMSAA
ncbi:hypothetical protein B0920_02570 [Massilia sp. KIM]|nr:hypothetical protein B0920_02570 [Massilia sp. KIM]